MKIGITVGAAIKSKQEIKRYTKKLGNDIISDAGKSEQDLRSQIWDLTGNIKSKKSNALCQKRYNR